MIRNLKYATIADIGIFKLIYFNPKKEIELVQFCNTNGISYLPSICKKHVYKLIDGRFIEKSIDDYLIVNPFDRIFDESTLKKFETVNHNEIRFIMENGKIRGAVHIIDYNSPFISIEVYKALLQFESNLRILLINNGLKNEDFILWIKEIIATSNNKKIFWIKRLQEIEPDSEKKLLKKQEERKNANLFQTFYLRELLEFAISKDLIKSSDFRIEDIISIRNLIAHNKDVTSQQKEEDDTIIYNFEGLKKFVAQMKSFFHSYEVLADKVENDKYE